MPEILILILATAGALVAFVAVRHGAVHWGAAVALVAALLMLVRAAFRLTDLSGLESSPEEPGRPRGAWRHFHRR